MTLVYVKESNGRWVLDLNGYALMVDLAILDDMIITSVSKESITYSIEKVTPTYSVEKTT